MCDDEDRARHGVRWRAVHEELAETYTEYFHYGHKLYYSSTPWDGKGVYNCCSDGEWRDAYARVLAELRAVARAS